jgi:hypothetical protein
MDAYRKQSIATKTKRIHFHCLMPLVPHSSPGVKRRKQDHLQDRQRVKRHSKSFDDSHTSRMASACGLAAQLLKFCKCALLVGPHLTGRTAVSKGFAGIFCLFTP